MKELFCIAVVVAVGVCFAYGIQEAVTISSPMELKMRDAKKRMVSKLEQQSHASFDLDLMTDEEIHQFNIQSVEFRGREIGECLKLEEEM